MTKVKVGKLKNRLFLLLKKQEVERGRSISQAELARELALTKDTVGRWLKNDVERFDAPVVERMCAYFGCELKDLLYIDYGDDSSSVSDN